MDCSHIPSNSRKPRARKEGEFGDEESEGGTIVHGSAARNVRIVARLTSGTILSAGSSSSLGGARFLLRVAQAGDALLRSGGGVGQAARRNAREAEPGGGEEKLRRFYVLVGAYALSARRCCPMQSRRQA